MMSSTHIAVGVAVAALAVQPQTAGDVIAAVVGGAVGGLICDIDIRTGKLRRDTVVARVAVAVLAAVALYADWVFGTGIGQFVVAHASPAQLAGAGLFAVTCVVGASSEHRSFAHSLLAVALWGAGVYLVCEPLAVPFAAGALSHVALDLLNRRPVRLLSPLRCGFCLGVCRADGLVDKALCAAGGVVAVTALVVPFVLAAAGAMP